MFKFLWARTSVSAAEASADASSSSSSSADPSSSATGSTRAMHPVTAAVQDDWVLLPTDYDDMMSQSISNLDLVSASTMLPRSNTSRSRNHGRTSSAGATKATAATTTTTSSSSSSDATTANSGPTKSRRQLKYELRQRQAQEQAERTPRYDPHMARLRDVEFKMAKMSRLGLRSGRLMTSTHSRSGGGGGGRSTLTGAFAQQKAC
ncbi:hypothetical protein DFQ27_008877 [Actinomortierella ambigua]|uniref:Uncharacterized protein n=1 Tax=Actinomortierella ambigua TaxID=1343610 RepID=A0A9P6QHJ4_9FUNG|nr:hypothetical protein DFQ27_008877 [Actinomortierella ambigua]